MTGSTLLRASPAICALLSFASVALAQVAEGDAAPTEAEAPADGEATPSEGEAVADEVEAADAEAEEAVQDAWALELRLPTLRADVPEPDGGDWILLTTGEFLQGELKKFEDGDVTFDGEEFGVTTVEIDLVEKLRCNNVYIWVRNDLAQFAGHGQIVNGEAQVMTENGLVRFSTDELLRVVPSAPHELDYWGLLIRLGANGTTGNVDQVSGDGYVELTREDGISFMRASYHGVYAEVEEEETTKFHDGRFDTRLYMSERFYVVPLTARALYDKFQNIAFRGIGGAGAGYYIILDDPLDWSVEVAGTYTYTEYRQAPAGESRFDKSPQVRLSTRLVWEVTSDVDVDGLYEAYVDAADIDNTFHHAEFNLAIELFKDVDFTLGVSWDRQEQPQPLDDGSIPKRDDARWNIGLSIEF
jgi:hypothetical protein